MYFFSLSGIPTQRHNKNHLIVSIPKYEAARPNGSRLATHLEKSTSRSKGGEDSQGVRLFNLGTNME